MKIHQYIFTLLCMLWCCNAVMAQDSIVVISRLSNTQIFQQDSIVIVSTLGNFPSGIYQQDSLVISFEPFNFFILRSGTTGLRDLPVIEGLNVYPNPVNDVAILERKTVDEEFILQLYKIDGTALREEVWDAGSENHYLSLANHSPGLYILVVINKDQTKANCFRIVKR